MEKSSKSLGILPRKSNMVTPVYLCQYKVKDAFSVAYCVQWEQLKGVTSCSKQTTQNYEIGDIIEMPDTGVILFNAQPVQLDMTKLVKVGEEEDVEKKKDPKNKIHLIAFAIAATFIYLILTYEKK